MERTISVIGESKNREGYSIIEIATLLDNGNVAVDVYHVKTSNITPNGQNVVWGKSKNGTFYVRAIKA